MAMEIFSRCAICSSLIGLLLWPAQAQAAPLPGADRPRTEIRLGSGPSLGGSLKLNPIWELGFSTALPALNFQQGSYFQFDTGRASAYAMVQLFNKKGFYIAGVAGIFADLSLGPTFAFNTWGLQAGATFAYDLNQALTLRVNIVPGIDFLVPPTGWLLAPATGISVVWRPQPALSVSFGINGNGDLLGLSWGF